MSSTKLSKQLLKWFAEHGRKNLPWQQNINAYRVWVSEIMLQQTQVATVIPYFEKFMQRFPDIFTLAAADRDIVLHYWSGLGYYSRAKNLHKTAQIVVEEYDGQLPDSVEQLTELPGIGRSTAGAICAIAFQKHASILDGNVKRVLARYHAIDGWPGKTETLNKLWQHAESHTPKQQVADYTQAIMDLGATICTRSQPQCLFCPLQNHCKAYKLDLTSNFPGKKPKKQLPVKSTLMLVISYKNSFLLQQRPITGIWPGLWSFIELKPDDNLDTYCKQTLNIDHFNTKELKGFRHTFSHYHLDITIQHIQLSQKPKLVMEDSQQLWYNMRKPQPIGLAAPVSKILQQASQNNSNIS